MLTRNKRREPNKTFETVFEKMVILFSRRVTVFFKFSIDVKKISNQE